jgi:RNA polymerase sigma-70 factor (ECF subfamily)
VDAPTFSTAHLQDWLARARAGDAAARDELLRACWGRLERLARTMLARFPGVRRRADTGDVLQSSLLRLLRALEQVPVSSTRAFFGLAAEQMRRELLDLARHFAARGAVLPAPGGTEAEPGPAADPPAAGDDLGLWCAFHEAVERLPAAEREVVGLTYYHGWAQADIAALFQVSERTIRRWWQSACLRLNDELGGEWPLN